MNKFRLLVTGDSKIFTIITYCRGKGCGMWVCNAPRSRPAVFILNENRSFDKRKTKSCNDLRGKRCFYDLYISCRRCKGGLFGTNQIIVFFFISSRSLENGIIIYDIIHTTRTFNYAHFSTTTSVQLKRNKAA